MGEIEAADDRAADIGIDVPWNAAEPCLLAVEILFLYHKSPALDHLLHSPDAAHGFLKIAVADRYRTGHDTERYQIVSQLLQCGIGVGCIVGRCTVEQRRRFLGCLFFQQGKKALAFSPPLATVLLDLFSGLFLVKREVAHHPAVFDLQVVQLIEHPRQ